MTAGSAAGATSAAELASRDLALIRALTELHALTSSTTGAYQSAMTGTQCACGWACEPTKNLRPQWEDADGHLASRIAMHPGTVTGKCWCSRLIVQAQSTGAWYHADRRFQPHDARPKEGQ